LEYLKPIAGKKEVIKVINADSNKYQKYIEDSLAEYEKIQKD